ncbi:MAG TPA: phosphoglycerate dehydrogenase [Chloroflexota bacterium]|nr:phosphoglycerate dehydrogenase [Chloroflexota bacterium]
MATYQVLVTSWAVEENNPELERLRAIGCTIQNERRPSHHSEAEMRELIPGIDAVIAASDRYSASVIEAADRLKVITRVGVGYDAIDLPSATARGVIVSTTPGTNQDAVADLAFGLILALARDIPLHDRLVRSGKWERHTGVDVNGKTLGILGLGKIGKGMARRGRGFSMRVIAHDPFWDEEFARANQVERRSLDEVVRDADFLTLHLPASPDTDRVMNAERLRAMKPTAFLINTARGTLVDEPALDRALREGWIAGAALDVFDKEPPWGSAILQRENIIFSPHVAGFSQKANELAIRMAVDNTINVLTGKPPLDCVNPDVLRT